MRKIGLSLATLALAGVAATVPALSNGAPSPGDTNGPPCRDINGPNGIGGQFNYTSTSTPGTYNLSAQLLLGPDGTTAPCKNVTYTLYVITNGADESTAQKFPLDGSAQWLNLQITDSDTDICVFATTSHNNQVFDRAPDTVCLQLTADTTGAGGGFH